MFKKIIKKILKYPLIFINHIYTYFFYKNQSKQKEYLIDDMFEKSKKVLIISPHVDDETIGLGGTLIKHKKAGDEVCLVYVSDGGGSTTELSKSEVIKLRKKEGEKLGEVLNINSIYFLDEPDGYVDSSKEELIEKIEEILEIESPEIIYTPFLIDGHKDHVESTKSVLKAIESWNSNFANIYMYEVNLPISLTNINSVSLLDKTTFNEKKKLYDIFKSQWAMGFGVFNLIDRRKSLIIKKGYAAEVFVKGNLYQFKKVNSVLKEEGFKPQQFRQLSSEYNLLLSFKKNRQLKKKYNKVVNYIFSKELSKKTNKYI
ncbi:PIG-L family deacetylase [Anaerosalibacter bizertensis]|uniref:PIG-L family deacetylase n=1 Tax=Anaerosalibacter bizertensis TaxID=932217 RepID=UPI003517A625